MNTKTSVEKNTYNGLKKYRNYISTIGIALIMNSPIQAQSNCYNFSDVHSKGKKENMMELNPFVSLGTALHSGAYEFVTADITAGLECELQKIVVSLEGGLSKPIYSNDKFGRTPEGRDRIVQGSLLYVLNKKHKLGAYIALSSLEEKIEEGFPTVTNDHLHDKILEGGLRYEYALNNWMQMYALGNINNFNVFKTFGTGGSVGVIFKL